jgi:translation initiation factor IF-1
MPPSSGLWLRLLPADLPPEGRGRPGKREGNRPTQSSRIRRSPIAYDLSPGVTIAGRKPRRPRTPHPPKADTSNKEAPLELFGTIKQVFPSTTFSVELENGQTILAHIAGRLRRHRIKILPGDRVDLEISPYDLTKGRIVYRYRAGEARRSA